MWIARYSCYEDVWWYRLSCWALLISHRFLPVHLRLSKIEQSGECAAVRTPMHFGALQSLAACLIELLNWLISESLREEQLGCSSWWDSTIKWHESPFSSEKQGTFFANLAHRILAAKDYYRDSPRSVHQSGISNRESRLRGTIWGDWEHPSPWNYSRCRCSIQIYSSNEALQRIADFFRQHPLVDASNAGFQEHSRFSFKYPAYADYFIKQYLSMRFGSLSDKLRDASVTREEILYEFELFILELFENAIMQRATNALFFLCWDNLQLEKLGFAMVTLFEQPNKMDSECFRYLLTYSLIFVKLYSDFGKRKSIYRVGVLIICAPMIWLSWMAAILIHILLRWVWGFVHLVISYLKTRYLSNVTYSALAVLVYLLTELLPLEEVVLCLPQIMKKLMIQQKLAKCMCPLGPQVTIRLIEVTIHEETLDAFQMLEQKYRNVELYKDNINVVNFQEISSNPYQSPAKRLIDQMMRLAKKHRRGSFGVFREKLFGRCAVPCF